MGRSSIGSSFADFEDAVAESEPEPEPPSSVLLRWPFGHIESLDRHELQETAYELFFTSCRSAPGFGGRTPLTYYSSSSSLSLSTSETNTAEATTSRVKRGLGLRTRQVAPPPMNDTAAAGKAKQRPMTSAEIMQRQMGVTEQSDNRLRKMLMRTLIGKNGRRVETMVLPLELLQQAKPSEFNDTDEYHLWQRRQLKILEAGLSRHPSSPLDHLNSAALSLSEIVQSSELKPIDTTSKDSGTMHNLCKAVAALAWRNPANSPDSDVCNWANGYPFNVHLYLLLLHAMFDLQDATFVLEEVDELIELMKRTWTVLGINKMIHNVCLTWILFEQYVVTGMVEPDLMGAALAMLSEVAADAKKADRDVGFVKILAAALSSMQIWADKKLMDYHGRFPGGAIGMMENELRLALSVAKIIAEDLPGTAAGMLVHREDSTGDRVDRYIRSSLRCAFAKVIGNGSSVADGMDKEVEEDPSNVLLQLAEETEALANFEKGNFSPILKRWHPVPTAVAVVTLHTCFGAVLKKHLERISNLTNGSVTVLLSAEKLEKVLVQMVVEDSVDCDDGGKCIVQEMIPFEVDSVITSLMKDWIGEKIKIGRECYEKAQETESWKPKSKSERYAQSAVDLMKIAKAAVDEFFTIPGAAREDFVRELAEGWDALFLDYTAFVASCGTKESCIPSLPPLTRCNQDPRFFRLWGWNMTATCTAGIDLARPGLSSGACSGVYRQSKPRPSASRGTQRLYVRLNTLHYLLALIHSIDKSLSLFFSRGGGGGSIGNPSSSRRRITTPSHFDGARSSVQSAILEVAEVAAFRLVFTDSRRTFYDSLYLGGVTEARIQLTADTLKQNLTLLVSVLTDRAQGLAVREVMKAAFYAFVMVLLAGGNYRTFVRSDHGMIAKDLESLKRVFCGDGGGEGVLVAEEVVEKEAEVVEAIIILMGQSTQRLIEDFTTSACEIGGFGGMGDLQQVPLPPTNGKFNRLDPNTLLRVLCHRNDVAASWFLKKTFHLPRRR